MSNLIQIPWRTRQVTLEYVRLNPERTTRPVIVFLHEGLGCVAMWRDFPQQVCDALNCQGLVYSRPGYGKSTPRARDEHWDTDFMHQQAHEVLPALLKELPIDPKNQPVWLFGHSDGASIALLAATRCIDYAGLIVMAPHIMVEDISERSIRLARETYQTTDLRAKLARYHADPDSAFYGWNDAWLNPAFRGWSIEPELVAIQCPVLAIQGARDEYGTMAQIRGIAARVPNTQLLELENCGHSPQRDQPEAVIAAAKAFFERAHTSA